MSVSQKPSSTPDPNERFIKTDLSLLAIPGLSPRLRELYGRLRFHAGKDGKCCPTHATLAREIGLGSPRSREHVQRLLKQLQRLRLIEWKRGKYSNAYRVLDPDVTFLASQMRQKSHISDVMKKSHRKDSIGSLKEVLKEGTHPPTPQRTPSQKPEPDLGDCATDVARGVRAPISRKGVVSENAAATGLFQEFIGVFLAAGKKLNDRDVERARKLWRNFNAPEHAAILEHLKRAVVDGTWSSERYIPMPASYLESKAWTRIGPGRVLKRPPQQESKAESAQRRAEARFLRGER